jgi:hypothetical protein
MDESIKPILLKNCAANEVKDVQHIQELWGGYGQLNRVVLDNKTVVLKLIKFPHQQNHPRGHNTEIGHLRKKKSYQVESCWYQNYNAPIENSILPRHIASGDSAGYQYLILEDLRDQSFLPKSSINFQQVKSVLRWLAHFHRHFLNREPKDLWKIGTYWHLETRPDEFALIKDPQLKEAAPLIDKRLNEACHQSFVHGDANLSNFLFNDKEAASVDFQYVGGGVGIKDVAYFLSSIYSEADLFSQEQACLNYYFNELALPKVEKEWRELYPLAWCDFYRFLQGWSPGHWKINSYSEKMKERVLECL